MLRFQILLLLVGGLCCHNVNAQDKGSFIRRVQSQLSQLQSFLQNEQSGDETCEPSAVQQQNDIVKQLTTWTQRLKDVTSQECQTNGKPKQPSLRPNKPLRPKKICRKDDDTGEFCTIITTSNGKTTIRTTRNNVLKEEWVIDEDGTSPNLLTDTIGTTIVIKKRTCKGSRCIDVESKGGVIKMVITEDGDMVEEIEMTESGETTDTTSTDTDNRPVSPGGTSTTTKTTTIKKTCRFTQGGVICTTVTDINGRVKVTITKDGSNVDDIDFVRDSEESILTDTSRTTKTIKTRGCSGGKCVDLVNKDGKIIIKVTNDNGDVETVEEIIEKTTTNTKDIKDRITSNDDNDETLEVLTDTRTKSSRRRVRKQCISYNGDTYCKEETDVDGQIESTTITRNGVEVDETWETVIRNIERKDREASRKVTTVRTTITKKCKGQICVESTDVNGVVTVKTTRNGQTIRNEIVNESESRDDSGAGAAIIKTASKSKKCKRDSKGNSVCTERSQDFDGNVSEKTQSRRVSS